MLTITNTIHAYIKTHVPCIRQKRARCCELCNWCRFLGLIDTSWCQTMTGQAIRLSPEIPIRWLPSANNARSTHKKVNHIAFFCTCTPNNRRSCRYDQKSTLVRWFMVSDSRLPLELTGNIYFSIFVETLEQNFYF